MQSCQTCPSFVTDNEEIRNLMGKPIGVPICARKGHVLDRPRREEEATRDALIQIATNCDSHGEAKPDPETTRLAPPMVGEVNVEIMAKGSSGEKVTTCRSCVHYVDQRQVAKQWEFMVPFCRARGILIFRPNQDCKSCDYGTETRAPDDPGMNDEIENDLLPQYTAFFRLPDETALEGLVTWTEGDEDPADYPTDQEVTPEDDAKGIRAWRNIYHPENEKLFVPLPVWKREVFTDEQRETIPATGNQHHPELYIDHTGLFYRAAVAWKKRKILAMIGPPGVGKTDGARTLAWIQQGPFTRLQGTEQTDEEDFLGFVEVTDGSTHFEMGRLPEAVSVQGITLVDELNRLNQSLQDTLRPFGDSEGSIRLEQAHGVKVNKHFGNVLMYGFNPDWDARNIGANQLADADRDRFLPAWIGLPPEAIERQIIKRHCAVDGYDLPDETLGKIMKIAVDIRENVDQGSFPGTWGLRPQISVASLTEYLPIVEAYRMASLDYFEPSVRSLVFDAIATHCPEAGLAPDTGESF